MAVEGAGRRPRGARDAFGSDRADLPEPGPRFPTTDQEAVRDTAALERSREAAGYRVRLRAAEEQVAERDAALGAMRAEVDRLHRVEAERLADAKMGNPADLWLVADLSDLRDDAGRLDSERVTAKVAEVVKERPAWRARTVGFDGGARTRSAPPRSPGLSDLLKPGQAWMTAPTDPFWFLTPGSAARRRRRAGPTAVGTGAAVAGPRRHHVRDLQPWHRARRRCRLARLAVAPLSLPGEAVA